MVRPLILVESAYSLHDKLHHIFFNVLNQNDIVTLVLILLIACLKGLKGALKMTMEI